MVRFPCCEARAMSKRPLRKTNRTTLIVVEGETEKAFVTHLKANYYRRGMQLSVRIECAHGFGPAGVIDKLKAVAKTADFDQRIALFDADIPLTPAEAKWLKAEKIGLLIATPAIEATLLATLAQHAPDSTSECKKKLQKLAPGDQTEISYYQKYFALETLEEMRHRVDILGKLIAAVCTTSN